MIYSVFKIQIIVNILHLERGETHKIEVFLAFVSSDDLLDKVVQFFFTFFMLCGEKKCNS